jgi:hypothetical protein
MDSYLNIVSLALAVAALVPVLIPGPKQKLWTLTVAALCLVILVAGYQLFKDRQERHAIDEAKDDMITVLQNKLHGQSFEELFNRGYYANHDIANSAIDDLVRSKKVQHEQIDTKDQAGNTFRIRRYYLAPSD